MMLRVPLHRNCGGNPPRETGQGERTEDGAAEDIRRLFGLQGWPRELNPTTMTALQTVMGSIMLLIMCFVRIDDREVDSIEMAI